MRWAWALLFAAAACVTVPVVDDTPKPRPAPPPEGPIVFEFESLDSRSVSAPALRGKPAVLAFVRIDTLAGQAEAGTVAALAADHPDDARYVLVALEPKERRELVQAFVHFFTDKAGGPLLTAMADADLLLGLGPFGDVRGLTVIVLDAGGRAVLSRHGIVPASDIARALAKPPR